MGVGVLARRLYYVVPVAVWATEYLALRSAMGDMRAMKLQGKEVTEDMRALRLQGQEVTEEDVLLGCPLDIITAISQAC